jgi:hypothetical protein
MNKEKQIEEMAQKLTDAFNDKRGKVSMKDLAEVLHNSGYRKSEWISVEDRLPDELFAAVLIYCPDRDNIYCAYLNARNEWHIFDYGAGQQVDERVTHWMPLPSPPTEKEN